MVLFTGTQAEQQPPAEQQPLAEQQPPAETVASQVTEAHKVSYRSHDLQLAWFAGDLVLKATKKLHLSNEIAFFQG